MVPPSARSIGGCSAMPSRICCATSGTVSMRAASRPDSNWAARSAMRRKLPQRPAERQQITRCGIPERRLGQQAFEIADRTQHLAQSSADNGFARKLADGIQPCFNFVEYRNTGSAAGVASSRPPIPVCVLIEDRDQCSFAALSHEQRIHQFQVPDGCRIQHH